MAIEGTIIFFRTPFHVFKPLSWLAWIIRVFTGAYYNHVGIVHEVNGVLVITEANEKGVNPTPLQKRLKETESELLYVRKKFKRGELDKLIRIWGSNYGEWTLVKYAWSILTGRPMRSKKARTGEVWVCSHVVAWVIGMDDWWRVNPKELYKRVTR